MRPPCAGSIHVIPVPLGMTEWEAWQEITTLGALAEHRRPIAGWANMQCPGGEHCVCRNFNRSRIYRHYHNDKLVDASLLGRLAHWWDHIRGRR